MLNLAGLPRVSFYGISGGLVSNNKHLSLITAAVRQRQHRHVIACIGGNDLDTSDPGSNPRDLDYMYKARNIPVPMKALFLFTESYYPQFFSRGNTPDKFRP